MSKLQNMKLDKALSEMTIAELQELITRLLAKIEALEAENNLLKQNWPEQKNPAQAVNRAKQTWERKKGGSKATPFNSQQAIKKT